MVVLKNRSVKQCRWRGISGIEYMYNIYPMNTTWDDIPGNYIIAKETAPHRWFPIYIGQTNSLKDSLPYNNELPCINNQHWTHIHAHSNQSASSRLIEENDLLDNYSPPCNDKR